MTDLHPHSLGRSAEHGPPRRRTKVLHMITRLIVGGAQDNTLITAERHDRERFEVHVASGPGGELVTRARAAAEAFHLIPHLVNPISPLDDVRALREIVALLRRERYDVVHTHSSKAGTLGRIAARIARVPVVVHTVHGSPFHPLQPRWKQALFVNVERAVRPLADAILTLSDRDRAEFIARGIVDEDRSQTVYTGMDFGALAPSPGVDPAATRQSLGVPEGGCLILMVGRHDRQKAPDLLLRAFAQVAAVDPLAVLAFAGDGPIREEVEALAGTLGVADRTRFLGTRSDVPDLLAAADIFSFSSVREAMGRAMLEAMIAGLPVVVPYTSGIPEVARPGETGLLFEVGDVAGIAEHLLYLIRQPDERARLGANARELVLSLFDAQVMVDSIETVYLDRLAAIEQ